MQWYPYLGRIGRHREHLLDDNTNEYRMREKIGRCSSSDLELKSTLVDNGDRLDTLGEGL